MKFLNKELSRKPNSGYYLAVNLWNDRSKTNEVAYMPEAKAISKENNLICKVNDDMSYILRPSEARKLTDDKYKMLDLYPETYTAMEEITRSLL